MSEANQPISSCLSMEYNVGVINLLSPRTRNASRASNLPLLTIAHIQQRDAIREQLEQLDPPEMVRNHISIIFSKLQVADCAQALLKVRDAGLG